MLTTSKSSSRTTYQTKIRFYATNFQEYDTKTKLYARIFEDIDFSTNTNVDPKGEINMEIANQPSFYFTLKDQNGNTEVTGNFTGESILESGDDLRFKAILALLNSIDRANFKNENQQDLFSQYINEIEETLNEMKQHERFQGKTNG